MWRGIVFNLGYFVALYSMANAFFVLFVSRWNFVILRVIKRLPSS